MQNRNFEWGGVVTPSSLCDDSPTKAKAKVKDRCEQRLEELRQASILQTCFSVFIEQAYWFGHARNTLLE